MTTDDFLPINKTKILKEKKLLVTKEFLGNKNVLIIITVSMKGNEPMQSMVKVIT